MAEKLSDRLAQVDFDLIHIRQYLEESGHPNAGDALLTVASMEETLREATAIVRAMEDAPQCEWTFDEFTDSWDTDCEAKFTFIAGGPEDNGVRHCHCCGKRVKLVEVPSGCS